MTKSADAFRTISEVADWLGIPAHVLRFWESKFTQVKPVKRAGGRRYYRPADMQLLGGIRKLLHDEGMTIKGVQKIMRDQGVRHVAAMSPPLDADLEAMAGIALDVPEAEDEPRGQIVSFDRTAGGTEKQSASKAQPADAEPPAERTEPQEPAQPSAQKERSDHAGDEADDLPAEETPASDAAHSETLREPATDQSSQPDVPADGASAPDKAETDREPAAQHHAPDECADAAQPADTSDSQVSEAATDESPLADGLAASAANAADDAAGAATASPRVAPIDTPDDPPDTIAAPPSALSILAGIERSSTRNAAQYADVSARLTDLRQRIAGGRTSS